MIVPRALPPILGFFQRQRAADAENLRLLERLETAWGVSNRVTIQRDAANARADKAEAEVAALRAEFDRLAEENGRLTARLEKHERVEVLP